MVAGRRHVPVPTSLGAQWPGQVRPFTLQRRPPPRHDALAMPRPINPEAGTQRAALRTFGFLLVVPGAILTLVGVVSFFSGFGDGPQFGEPQGPRYFWCAFLGIPLLGVGMNLLRLGYLGTVTRYVAGEIEPAASDTLNTMARNTAPAARDFARAVREGLAASHGAACPHCGSIDPGSGEFCDDCGKPVTAAACPKCAGSNAAGARFCTHCGTPLAS